MRIRFLSVAAALLAVVACGNPSTPGAGPTSTGEITPAGTTTASPATTTTPPATPSPSLSPTVSGPRTLTQADTGTTVLLKVGESVRVVLPAEYYVPDTTGAAVSRSEPSGGYPTGEPATTTFTAIAVGNVDLNSTNDYACLHATPSCSLPQQLWSVRVSVT